MPDISALQDKSMENNEKTPRETPSGEHRGPKKPYYKHHKRGHNNQNRPKPQTGGGDNITVRPGRYDTPPTKSDAEETKPAQKSWQGEASEGRPNNRRPHHRHDRRRNHHPRPKSDAPELTEIPADKSVDTSVGAPVDASVTESEKIISEADMLTEAIEKIVTESAPEYSEYITTAGSLDAEIIDELNSVSDSDIELIENSETEDIPAELATYEVVGIRFKTGGKIYYFDPNGFTVPKNTPVIVETSRGIEFGVCDIANKTVTEREVVLPLRPVARLATKEDEARHAANVAKEKEAFSICSQKILDHKLGMKLIDVEYAFDGSKLLFYFTAEGRVDFRELVKDLASVFRTRIELRQIGIRDETKLLGGIGICGRPFCCKTFLSDFVQVSIKMAKEQNLSLNSVKISGACGRLMCCLRYEYDTYQEEIKKTPKVDQIVSTPDGEGTVIEVQPLAGLIRVRFGSKTDMIPPKVYHRDDVTVIGGKGVKPKEPISE